VFMTLKIPKWEMKWISFSRDGFNAAYIPSNRVIFVIAVPFRTSLPKIESRKNVISLSNQEKRGLN